MLQLGRAYLHRAARQLFQLQFRNSTHLHDTFIHPHEPTQQSLAIIKARVAAIAVHSNNMEDDDDDDDETYR
eukprot:4910231-Karenia_brevis.AAC.1